MRVAITESGPMNALAALDGCAAAGIRPFERWPGSSSVWCLPGWIQRAEVDEAIALHKPLEAFLSQSKEEATTMADGYDRLERILRGEETQN